MKSLYVLSLYNVCMKCVYVLSLYNVCVCSLMYIISFISINRNIVFMHLLLKLCNGFVVQHIGNLILIWNMFRKYINISYNKMTYDFHRYIAVVQPILLYLYLSWVRSGKLFQHLTSIKYFVLLHKTNDPFSRQVRLICLRLYVAL